MSTPTDGRSPGRIKRFEHGSRVPGWDDSVDLGKPPAEVPEPATTPVPEELRTTIEEFMARYPDRHSAVIPALHAAQAVHGWCSPEAIDQVAAVMRVTPAYVSSIAGFYDMFDTEPVGRHRIYVCTNISCSLNGADELFLELVEATAGDDDFAVRQFECLGACDIAPMVSVDGTYLGPVPLDAVPRLVDQLRAGDPPLPKRQLARRPVADPGANE